MISLVMAAALGASVAMAAPLDEGFRGRTWGSAPSDADKACKVVPDPITEGVKSIFCDEPLIKGHPLQVMAMYRYIDSRLSDITVLYSGPQSQSTCELLLELATGAWGPQTSPAGSWASPRKWRTVSHDKVYGAVLWLDGRDCSLTVFDQSLVKESEERKKLSLEKKAKEF